MRFSDSEKYHFLFQTASDALEDPDAQYVLPFRPGHEGSKYLPSGVLRRLGVRESSMLPEAKCLTLHKKVRQEAVSTKKEVVGIVGGGAGGSLLADANLVHIHENVRDSMFYI